MARVIFIAYTRHAVAESKSGPSSLVPIGNIPKQPVIVRANGHLWEEGCAFLAYRALDVSIGLISMRTLHSIAWRLHAYLDFCEQEMLDPMIFGRSRSEKPTYLYRGYLLDRRRGKRGEALSGSTVSGRIAAVVMFYTWLIDTGLLGKSSNPYSSKSAFVTLTDHQGHTQSIRVSSTDLSIRRGRQHGSILEGGLYPVSRAVRDEMIRSAYSACSEEFSLMLEIGFRTGMRIQTICGLTTRALSMAYAGNVAGFHYLAVGPRHNVPTKLGIDYTVQIPSNLLQRIWDYVSSTRRAGRCALAARETSDLVFLTRFGQPYCKSDRDSSTSISHEIKRLRKKLPHLDLRDFHFHCTRATFATSVVMAGLEAGERPDRVVNQVRILLGHKNSQTSLAYIKFVDDLRAKSAIDTELSVTS